MTRENESAKKSKTNLMNEVLIKARKPSVTKVYDE